jgi:plasmid stabilization system protein ParE
MNVRVSETVRNRVAAIAQWYNTQPSRYGLAFLDEFERALEYIQNNPRACSRAEDGREETEDREFFIARFQQRVIFTIVNEEAYVLAVVHASRQEGAWQRNLPEDLTS